MVKAAYSCGKPALGVGAGNVPAYMEKTCNVRQAVNDIVMSKAFDNGMICASEQAVIIDKEIYEAAKIDGASKLKQITAITLPLLRPTIVIMTLMAIGRVFYSDFGLFYQVPMNAGTLFSTTQTIDTYVYRGLMEQGNVGMSSAAGVYQSLVGFALVMIANFIVRKKDPENALF